MLISAKDNQPSSQTYFDNLLHNIELPWNEIYLIACKTAVNSNLRCFYYKIINNVLYLNKKLFYLYVIIMSRTCFRVNLHSYSYSCLNVKELETRDIWSFKWEFFQFGKIHSPLCSFSHIKAETILYVFHKCSVTEILWNQLLLFFEMDLDFPDLTS